MLYIQSYSILQQNILQPMDKGFVLIEQKRD